MSSAFPLPSLSSVLLRASEVEETASACVFSKALGWLREPGLEKKHTQLQEMYGIADSRWLLTFNENIQKAIKTRGFLLIIQQGAFRENIHVRMAMENQAAFIELPRICIHTLPITHVRGGNIEAEKEVEDAIAAAHTQWAQGICPEVQTIGTVYEEVEGKAFCFDETGQIQGFARCIYGNGDTYEGEFLHGMRHGRGTYRFATCLTHSSLLTCMNSLDRGSSGETLTDSDCKKYSGNSLLSELLNY